MLHSLQDGQSDTFSNRQRPLNCFADKLYNWQLSGRAQLRLHHPEPREVAILHDEPWEEELSITTAFPRWQHLQDVLQGHADQAIKTIPAAAPTLLFFATESTDGIV